jgi:hypothetical protein
MNRIWIRVIKPKATATEHRFRKQMAMPKSKRNIPRYIGFLLHPKTPTVTSDEDFSNFSVVPCFLKRSLHFPISMSPQNAITNPPKLYGKGIRLYDGKMK